MNTTRAILCLCTVALAGCSFDLSAQWPDATRWDAGPLETSPDSIPVDLVAPDHPRPLPDLQADGPVTMPDADPDPTAWVTTGGGGAGDDVEGFAVGSDPKGNVYVAGYLEGTGVTIGSKKLSSKGDADVLVVKLDPAGNVLWATTAGGIGMDRARGLAVADNGDLFVTGFFTGAAQFGTKAVKAIGGIDIFVSKLSPNGDFIWTTVGGGLAKDKGEDVALDSSGSPVVTGWFHGVAGFKPFATAITSKGGSDLFLAKLNPTTGAVAWLKSYGGTGVDAAQGIALDGNDVIYIAGYFNSGSWVIGTDVLKSNGGYDVFVARLSPSAAPVWAAGFGGADSDESRGIALTPNGAPVVTGFFESAGAIFGTHTLSSKGSVDLFVTRLNPNLGTVVWATSAGGADAQAGYDVSVDPKRGEVVVAGWSSGPFTFGPASLKAFGGDDLLLCRLKLGTGAPVWATVAGGQLFDRAHGVTLVPGGGTVVAGTFADKATFGKTDAAATGSNDLFVWKLAAP
jgi:hypothetical protein